MKRRPPFGAPDWSGCGTMLGLNSAEASNEYSLQEIGADQLALDL